MTRPARRCADAESGTPSPSASTRSPDFDQQIYRRRNVVERCFNRLKTWRDLATRYAKRASIYQGSLTLIAAIIWLT